MQYSAHLQHAVSLILNGPLAGDMKACEGRGQTERKERKKNWFKLLSYTIYLI